MANPRTRAKKKDSPLGRILWAIFVIGIALGIFRWWGDGLSILEPGWFDRARHNVEEGVDRGGDVVQNQIDQRIPETIDVPSLIGPATPPAEAP